MLQEATVMIAVSRRVAKGIQVAVTLVNLDVETYDCVHFNRFTTLEHRPEPPVFQR